jgi:purine-nucleoside/S-methyl-5'-thioadenosine phosphorylase / adenosine deaminase
MNRINSKGDIYSVGLPDEWPDEIRGGLTLRTGGVSLEPWASLNFSERTGDAPETVAENLSLLSLAEGIDFKGAARIGLEHGCHVIRTEAGGRLGSADGMVTRALELPLALTVADCYPLFLATPAGEIGLLHCGWRGIVGGIAEAGVIALCRISQVPASEVWGWIGPGIGSCCFEVSPEVARQFPVETHVPSQVASGNPRIDLIEALTLRLSAAGLRDKRISAAAECTACERERFFSHRGEQGNTGRMLAWLLRTRG